MSQNHRIFTIHPKSGEILPAFYKEDWFGKGKDAISFGKFNSPNYAASKIEWEFEPDSVSKTRLRYTDLQHKAMRGETLTPGEQQERRQLILLFNGSYEKLSAPQEC